MPGESPEVIEQRLRESRRNLTAKVADLERDVTGTVHETREAVSSTMHSLHSGVNDTFATVNGGLNDTIKSVVGTTTDAVDVRPHIRANPLAAVGASLAAGLVAGLLVTRKSHGGSSHAAYGTAPNGFAGVSPPPHPSWIDGLLDQVAGEVKRVAGEVLTVAGEQAKQTVHQGVPNLVNGLLTRVASQAGVEPRRTI